MQERIESVHRSIDSIRKSGTLPHWRMVYAETLLERAEDYIAIDREPEANMVLDKLSRWIATHEPPASSGAVSDAAPMVFWNAEMLRNVVVQVRATLSKKKMLVPSTEREAISRRIDEVEKWLDESRFQEPHEELLSLRSAMIARLRRSYRARIASTDYRHGSFVQPAGTLVGPYNSRHTLEETFQVIGERDPIWIEDFLDIYNDLFRIVERLVPQDKK